MPLELEPQELPQVIIRATPPPRATHDRLAEDILAVGVDVRHHAWGGADVLEQHADCMELGAIYTLNDSGKRSDEPG
eukprot:621290-Alexandrium_andersonii.AAC.1